jgi:hypothetical protein
LVLFVCVCVWILCNASSQGQPQASLVASIEEATIGC